VRELRFVIFSEQVEFAQEMCRRLSELRQVAVVAIASEIDDLVESIKKEAPHVLFVDLGIAPHVVLDQLEGIQVPMPELLVCGPQDESRLILRAMQIGAKEFLPPAPESAEIRSAVERLGRGGEGERAGSERGPVIAVMGAKGGVGSTVVACQLAASLQCAGERTALIDLNFPLGDVALHFDVEASYTLSDVASEQEQLDATFVESILHEHPSGVHILAASPRIEDSELIKGTHVDKLIGVLRERFDWVVLDVSRNWNEATVRALDLADQILVITSLDVPTLHHAKKHMELLERLGHRADRIQPIVNRRSPMDAVSDKDFTSFLGRPPTASIPNDYVNTVNSVNEGRPIFQLAPRTPLDDAYRKLAEQVHEWCGIEIAGRDDATDGSGKLAARFRRIFEKRTNGTS
jgi:pilus assembly protein CpaE